VQKFTRPITREIAVGSDRLALTFSEQGISVRPVGSRKPPVEMSWPAFVSALAAKGAEPAPDHVQAAVQTLKAGGLGGPAAPPAESAPAAATRGPAERTPTAPAADESSVLGHLAKWLGQHRRRFLEGLAPGATPEQLQALEAALGRPVPGDLRTLLAWHNGQDEADSGCFREHWYLASTAEIESAWRELTVDPARGWEREWVPFLEDDRGNYVFLDTSQPGTPVREYWERNPEKPTVAPSLAAWLQEFVAGVERGEYAQDPERGLFMQR
jgi:cell wall assembly regulator SMI1